jgi:hypothetical protein
VTSYHDRDNARVERHQLEALTYGPFSRSASLALDAVLAAEAPVMIPATPDDFLRWTAGCATECEQTGVDVVCSDCPHAKAVAK